MSLHVPNLPEAEIHVWRLPWNSDAASSSSIRQLLAAYAGPDAPEVDRGEHGKPLFRGRASMLGFSWSHSRDTALFAVGRGPLGFEVGVDVERIRPRVRAIELAQRFFAPDETEWLKGVSEDRLLNAFLALWTAKEAVLKAHGGGLVYGLHRVSFAPDGYYLAPSVFDGEIGPADAWQVSRVELDEGLVGSVAWRGEDRFVRVFTFPL
jgi:4'-phosphopantetheinyl transferase